MCTKKSYCNKYRCLSWYIMKKDVVDLHFKLAEASLGVGGLPNLNEQINKLLNFLEQGTVTSVDLVKLWALTEEVTLADILRKAAETYESDGFGGQCEWVRGKMEAAGRALDKILTTGMSTLGLKLHPEFRNEANNSQNIRDLRKFVDAFVKWHLISAHSGFSADHNGLFSGAAAGGSTSTQRVAAAATEELDCCIVLGAEVCEELLSNI
jgi:hypothetical protein